MQEKSAALDLLASVLTRLIRRGSAELVSFLSMLEIFLSRKEAKLGMRQHGCLYLDFKLLSTCYFAQPFALYLMVTTDVLDTLLVAQLILLRGTEQERHFCFQIRSSKRQLVLLSSGICLLTGTAEQPV